MSLLKKESPLACKAIRGGREFKDKMHEVSIWLKETLKNRAIDYKKGKFREAIDNEYS